MLAAILPWLPVGIAIVAPTGAVVLALLIALGIRRIQRGNRDHN